MASTSSPYITREATDGVSSGNITLNANIPPRDLSFYIQSFKHRDRLPTMAPSAQGSDESNHTALLDSLDLYAVSKPFRNPNWKPPQRRNKNVKQMLSEASRKEASVLATQNNSGTSTPMPATGGVSTPLNGSSLNPNIAQAAQNLSTLMLEKKGRPGGAGNGPAVTYTNVESAPSLHPSSQRRYCDITGLPAPYTDPKTRLRYHNGEVFGLIRTLGQGAAEGYLAARGAHTILK